MRRVCVLLHRYAGLAMAFFLVVAGLSGSVLTFYHELEHWLNPELFTVPVRDTHAGERTITHPSCRGDSA